MLAASVGPLDKPTLTTIFVNGLEEQTSAKVFLLSPRGLKEMVADFRAQFELLATSVGPLDKPTLTAIFVNELEEQTRAEVFLLSPRGLKETIKVATRVEKKKVMVQPNQMTNSKAQSTVTNRQEFKTVT